VELPLDFFMDESERANITVPHTTSGGKLQQQQQQIFRQSAWAKELLLTSTTENEPLRVSLRPQIPTSPSLEAILIHNSAS
jgi:hypothetical protein